MPANYRTIEPGGGTSVPDRVLFIDVEPKITETDSPCRACVHSFGVACVQVCHLRGGKLSETYGMVLRSPCVLYALLADVADRHKATWVFGHNLGYDLTLLGFWEWLPRSGATFVDAVLEDPPTSVTIRMGKRLVKFVDVLNYWRLGLPDLVTAVGVRLAESDGIGGRQLPSAERCRAHVEVIQKCVLSLIHRVAETRCCSLRTTAAGLSWATYLKCFLDQPLYVPCDLRSRKLEREAYSGGLLSCVHFGFVQGPIAQLDTNSLYPSVMHDNLFPCRLVKRVVGLRPQELQTALRYYDGVCRCVSVRDRDLFTPFCHRDVHLGYLDYTEVLAGSELVQALERGQVRRVEEVCLYERADLFSSFVRHHYRAKVDAAKAGNRAEVMFAKLLLNSLHGKFAQKGRRWSRSPDVVSRGYYAYWWHRRQGQPAYVRARALAGIVETRVPGPDPRHAFPAIAACVTAAGRAQLRADIDLVGPDDFLYADTDSVHCLGPGRRKLEAAGRIDPVKLGYLRVERWGDNAEYWGPRHYRVGDRWCLSGVKPNATQVADGVYLQDAMMGVERTLETGVLNSVPVSDRVVRLSARSDQARRIYHFT